MTPRAELADAVDRFVAARLYAVPGIAIYGGGGRATCDGYGIRGTGTNIDEAARAWLAGAQEELGRPEEPVMPADLFGWAAE